MDRKGAFAKKYQYPEVVVGSQYEEGGSIYIFQGLRCLRCILEWTMASEWEGPEGHQEKVEPK